MDGIQQWDVSVFRWINSGWSHPWLDQLMPFLSGNRFFFPTLLALALFLIFKGGGKGPRFVLIIAVSILLGELLVTGPLKNLFERLRPFRVLEGTRLLVGMGPSYAMPSGHSAIWAGAAYLTFHYYRRTLWFMIPLAFGVGVSRIYNGVHWPTDVLAGWATGIAYAWLFSRSLEWLWTNPIRVWFPLWWRRAPSLLDPAKRTTEAEPPGSIEAQLNQHWTRLAYLLIGVLLVVRLVYIGTVRIELSEDEAYQWIWSKHLALSYYSKPPFIALAQWTGTHLWGDREIGVRFLSPCFAAILGVILFRFLSRETSPRAAFLFLVALCATPLLSVGSILMTVDPLTVLFWILAMLAIWRGVNADASSGNIRNWVWAGVWMGCGFLSKYSSPLQWFCFAVFLLLQPSARWVLKTRGPWIALAINVAATAPVLIWNASNDWVTMKHLSENGGLDREWTYSLRFFWDFVAAEFGLLNPVWFLAMAGALIGFRKLPQRPPLLTYWLSMGAPVFLFYLVISLRSRVQPNWIATGIVPMLMFAFLVGYRQAVAGRRWPGRVLAAGFAFGLPVVVVLHETRFVEKLTGADLPAYIDPLTRVRGHRDLARVVGGEREKLLKEGPPVFVIADHYGRTGLLSFYLPDGKKSVGTPEPVVTLLSQDAPRSQFWFWPEYRYERRQGQNAIFVQEVKIRKEGDLGGDAPPPKRLTMEFNSVKSLGVFELKWRDRTVQKVQLFACRGKR